MTVWNWTDLKGPITADEVLRRIATHARTCERFVEAMDQNDRARMELYLNAIKAQTRWFIDNRCYVEAGK